MSNVPVPSTSAALPEPALAAITETQRRERFHLGLSLLGAALWPALHAAQAVPVADPQVAGLGAIVVMLGSVPIALVVEILRVLSTGSVPRLMYRDPAVRLSLESPLPPSQALAEMHARALGHRFQGAAPTGTRLVMEAPQVTVNAFPDHAFTLEVTAEKAPAGSVLHVVLVMRDLLLVENNEMHQLDAMARHLATGRAVAPAPGLNFTLLSGVTMAQCTGALAVASSVGLLPAMAAAGTSAAGAIMVVLGSLITAGRRRRLFGLRLAAGALLACAAPWLTWLFSSWRSG